MTPVNHWKLGLFVVLGVVASCLAVVGLGANKLRREHEVFVTYFDESVQGLGVGSPVKFRGVQIGEVGKIGVASDRRHLVVESRVDVASLERLGLRRSDIENQLDGLYVPSNIRAQIVPQGITGVRFLQIDYFDTTEHAPPKLPFDPPKNYIPAARSSLASIEEALVIAAEQVPILTRQIKRVLTTIETILADIPWRKLTEDIQAAIVQARKLTETVDAKLKPVDFGKLQAEAEEASKSLRAVLEDARRLVKRIEAKDGLLQRTEETVSGVQRTVAGVEKQLNSIDAARTLRQVEGTLKRLDGAIASVDSSARSMNSASRSLEGVVRDSRGVPAELTETLKSLDRAAREIRNLADLLQRDSDMLLKGRARK
ncbi:MAG: MCE family protein [Planctomycetes bacterium]|nr:MCE family protein [Planctomycetota bacterium]